MSSQKRQPLPDIAPVALKTQRWMVLRAVYDVLRNREFGPGEEEAVTIKAVRYFLADRGHRLTVQNAGNLFTWLAEAGYLEKYHVSGKAPDFYKPLFPEEQVTQALAAEFLEAFGAEPGRLQILHKALERELGGS